MNEIPSHTPFLEVVFQPVPDGWAEILVAGLSEAGFDSFAEEEGALRAYIEESTFNDQSVRQLVNGYAALNGVTWSVTRLPDKNWNAIWESSYEPVLIANRCYIRAPFHPSMEAMSHGARGMSDPVSGIGYLEAQQRPRLGVAASLIEIVIEPKMSFGTAHHETTAMMIEALLAEDLTGKSVLDMGCGTGILAILSSRLGAGRVVAIDLDEWAVENATENLEKNNVPGGTVILGDVNAILEEQVDVILANINRNTLMEHLPAYAGALANGGTLLLSGFYSEDLSAIETRAASLKLKKEDVREKNNWIVAKFVK